MMIDLLTQYGFYFTGTCTCDGPKTNKYKNGHYKVYWNKKSKKFRIKHHGKAITNLIHEDEFEREIKKHFPERVVQI